MWLYITFLFWIKVRFAFKKIFLFNLQINVLYTTPFFYSCFLRWFSLSFSCHTRSADLISQPLYDVQLYYMCLCSSFTFYTHSRMYVYSSCTPLLTNSFKLFLQMVAIKRDAISTPLVKRTKWAEPSVYVQKLVPRYVVWTLHIPRKKKVDDDRLRRLYTSPKFPSQ